MKRLVSFFFILLATACIPAYSADESKVYRIMPVGDSITEGGPKTGGAYRPLLLEKLKQAGYRVEYVGSRMTFGSLPHEGYGGRKAEVLATVVPKHFQSTPADIVLIHAGHNHRAEEAPVPKIVAATEQMIAEFRKINPKVAVLVAKVIPSGNLPKYAYIPELNTELEKMAQRLNTPAQPVILVDQASGFDPSTDTITDKVHPNAQGAEKMSARWFEALKGLLQAAK